MSGNKISVKTLDLNQEFKDIAAQLDIIAAEHFGMEILSSSKI
jgi:5-methylcytosine-specific restriction enzyme subunit McrC